MRLGVIADTHIHDRYDELPAAVLKDLKKTDIIIHAGDFTSVEYYNELKAIKPLKAVLGNLDSAQLREYLKEKETFLLAKYKIGVMHGFGRAEGVFDLVKKTFDNTYDLVIFGHTHEPLCEKIGKTIFFNPGSPTDKIFTSVNAYGIIELDGKIEVKIVKL
ncbi:MAG: metallophosphoesterase family protein [Candidatus Omnitrophica bacterium]|nr:metallophosphoesterase family protein [Candidatus Omnitrophota bacterium]